ncbi:hypothetical protein Tco_0228449 [Tanacetum coccineum]
MRFVGGTHAYLSCTVGCPGFLKVSRAICPSITRASQSSASFGNPDILILSTTFYSLSILHKRLRIYVETLRKTLRTMFHSSMGGSSI